MKKKIIWSLGILVLVALIAGGIYIFGANRNDVKADYSIFKDTMVEMTWPEIKQAAKDGAIVLFPIGVIEEHGPHMGLSPDIYLACLNCRLVKQQLAQKGIRAIIAPPYYWGINTATGNFPGSFTVERETFKAVFSDTIGCLKSWGFTKVFCDSWHGDRVHIGALDSAIEYAKDKWGIDIYYIKLFAAPSGRPGFEPDYHAGAIETSAMWAFYPEVVREKIALNLKPEGAFEPLGYVGDPASFKLEKEFARSIKKSARYSALDIESVLKEK